jgi:hypothetical protein
MDPSRPVSEVNAEQHHPVKEKAEQRAREMAWENEGGRTLKDEKTAATVMNSGDAANDNCANAP